MGGVRFTQRQKGRMATANYKVHVPEVVVDAVVAETGMSKTDAFNAILKEFEYLVFETISMRYLKTERATRTVNGQVEISAERKLGTVHSDDVRDTFDDRRSDPFETRLLQAPSLDEPERGPQDVPLDVACRLRRA